MIEEEEEEDEEEETEEEKRKPKTKDEIYDKLMVEKAPTHTNSKVFSKY